MGSREQEGMGGHGPWVSSACVGGIPQMELMRPPVPSSSALMFFGRVLVPRLWSSVFVIG